MTQPTRRGRPPRHLGRPVEDSETQPSLKVRRMNRDTQHEMTVELVRERIRMHELVERMWAAYVAAKHASGRAR